jgi:redox-sensing transcriptional repressor
MDGVTLIQQVSERREGTGMAFTREIPEPTISRIPIYLRCFRAAHLKGLEMLSSADLEALSGIKSCIIRRDFSCFGLLGKPGVGYPISTILKYFNSIMHTEAEQRVMLVGAGNLGTALAGYSGMLTAGFKLAAVYDNNFSKIGRRMWELEILDIEHMPQANRRMQIRIGLITTPAEAAQSVADKMIASGVTAIVNFVPTRIEAPKSITLRNVDLAQELQITSYYLHANEQPGKPLPAIDDMMMKTESRLEKSRHSESTKSDRPFCIQGADI